jgi:hypothetical protein
MRRTDLPTVIPAPPIDLNPCQRRAWNAISPRLYRDGLVNELDGEWLVAFVAAYVWYRTARDRLLTPRGPKETEKWEAIGAAMRLRTRQFATAFHLLRRDDVEAAPLDASGDDTDIAKWFEEE